MCNNNRIELETRLWDLKLVLTFLRPKFFNFNFEMKNKNTTVKYGICSTRPYSTYKKCTNFLEKNLNCPQGGKGQNRSK